MRWLCVIAVYAAAILLASCGTGGPFGGSDTGEGSEGLLCEPEYPERPKDCTHPVDTAEALKNPEDFEPLCETKCETAEYVSICAAEICGDDGPLTGVESYPPLRGFQTIETFEFHKSPSLNTLKMLSDVETLHWIYLERLEVLENLEGLSSLKTIQVTLDLEKNQALRRVGPLPELEKVGSIRILANPELKSLEGLKGATIQADEDPGTPSIFVHIADNDSLENLDGLQGLEEVGGWLRIRGNAELKSLKGLENVQRVGTLKIHHNPKLPTCEARNFAERIEVEDRTHIEDNGSGTCEN